MTKLILLAVLAGSTLSPVAGQPLNTPPATPEQCVMTPIYPGQLGNGSIDRDFLRPQRLVTAC